jgi:hypothetical protein
MIVNTLKTSALLILLCLHSILFSQKVEQYHFNCVNETEKYSILEIDPYGNIYVVDEKNRLSIINSQGTPLFSYSNPNYGTLLSIDVQNPKKIMLFYKDAAIIQFLSEQLTPITEPISLFKLNYFNISLAAYNSSNSIFLFDDTERKLIILDFFMNEKSKVQILNSAFNPSKMVSLSNNKLLLQDPLEGFIFFDAFGTLEKEISLQIPNDFQINESKIFYIQDTTLREYNFEKLELLQLPLSEITPNAPQLIILKKSGQLLIGIDFFRKIFIGTKIF